MTTSDTGYDPYNSAARWRQVADGGRHDTPPATVTVRGMLRDLEELAPQLRPMSAPTTLPP